MRDIPHLITKFHDQKPMADEALEKFSRGEVNFWSPNVYPDLESYSNEMVDFFYRIVGLYQNTSDERGFNNWGIKIPKFDKTAYEILTTLLPRARHLFVIRHLRDVLESQKGRGWIDGRDELTETIDRWKNNIDVICNELSDRNKHLTIRFNRLLSDRENTVGTIEDFLGIQGIVHDVFNHKINTWEEDAGDHEGDSYTEPEKLTESEQDVVDQRAGDLLDRLDFID